MWSRMPHPGASRTQPHPEALRKQPHNQGRTSSAPNFSAATSTTGPNKKPHARNRATALHPGTDIKAEEPVKIQTSPDPQQKARATTHGTKINNHHRYKLRRSHFITLLVFYTLYNTTPKTPPPKHPTCDIPYTLSFEPETLKHYAGAPQQHPDRSPPDRSPPKPLRQTPPAEEKHGHPDRSPEEHKRLQASHTSNKRTRSIPNIPRQHIPGAAHLRSTSAGATYIKTSNTNNNNQHPPPHQTQKGTQLPTTPLLCTNTPPPTQHPHNTLPHRNIHAKYHTKT